ncbi:IMP cyclohydrolase [Ruminococcaceae bacterium OttesenSCG-928-O06]|nr:IMP cyclohydrolase [Ruminococcaceae bacterium OttesenSCG-928-O06]
MTEPANLLQMLQTNPYPGRGIVLGRSGDGMKAYIAYFIMGRSENSRNRVFAPHPEGGIVTQAANPARLQDPSLVIYAPVRTIGQSVIVTNGDQTDTIYRTMAAGGSFEMALRGRTFEPDAPNYTPRISGMLHCGYEGFSYQMAVLKTAGGNPAGTYRQFFEYPTPLPGQGHFVCTYADANPETSFVGEPVTVAISGGLDEFGEGIWQALNEDNKVALYVCSMGLEDEGETRIYNKYTVSEGQ